MAVNLDLYDRARTIPGRSLTRSKAPGRMFDVGRGPMYAASGDGAIITDVDGNEYIDMLCGLGAISLGYRESLRVGAGVFSLPHRLEVEAAEAVMRFVAPWASSVRFVKTGSEATHAAYRIAKAATGRRVVYFGDWAYHGWHEWSQTGVIDSCSFTFRNGQTFDDTRGHNIAAVFIEPHRWEPVDEDWLRYVRAFCDRVGALLVFDSMIYGGRFALGGTSQYFGVIPDLECFGKAFGNGQAVAFVVGNAALAEHGELISGTYSGCVSGLAAVVDTIKTYMNEPVIETLWERGRQLQAGLIEIANGHAGMICEGMPVHQRLRFLDDDPMTLVKGRMFAERMADRGVLWHPGCANIMYAHTPEQIERVVVAAEQSCRELL